ncbi:hypothetical protein GOV05_01670 [Candidatus Woesearchaeota archaeon]|nr:hypothetical protein [Candidatus Woesearchaeota archaeon]
MKRLLLVTILITSIFLISCTTPKLNLVYDTNQTQNDNAAFESIINESTKKDLTPPSEFLDICEFNQDLTIYRMDGDEQICFKEDTLILLLVNNGFDPIKEIKIMLDDEIIIYDKELGVDKARKYQVPLDFTPKEITIIPRGELNGTIYDCTTNKLKRTTKYIDICTYW